jgi:hypothetical protein
MSEMAIATAMVGQVAFAERNMRWVCQDGLMKLSPMLGRLIGRDDFLSGCLMDLSNLALSNLA